MDGLAELCQYVEAGRALRKKMNSYRQEYWRVLSQLPRPSNT